MQRNLYVWLFATLLVVGSVASLFAMPTVATATANAVTDPADRLGDAPDTNTAVGGTTADARITDVSYRGDGAVGSFEDTLALWQTAEHTFAITVASDEGVKAATVCLAITDTDTGLGCTDVSVPADGNRTATVAVGNWPANQTGAQTLDIDLRAANETGSLDGRTIPTTVIRRDGDLDGDGLTNERESSLGTALRSNDTDDDGLPDAAEVDTYETSPTEVDTDGDNLTDHEEIERYQTDPTKVDTDEDGLPDPRELELGTNPNKADTDGDGVTDGLEINTYGTNATAPDSDGDGLDDGAEINEYETNPLEPDTDGDGLTDNLEVNTYDTDPNQIDTDGDGLEDGAEVNEYDTDPTSVDTDGDGLQDGPEVNTYGTNPTNVDTDGDGLEDGPEVNEYETDPNAPDSDGDGISDPQEVTEAASDRMPLYLAGLTGVAVAAVAIVGFLAWTGRSPVARARTALRGSRSDPDSEPAVATASVESDRPEPSSTGYAAVGTPPGPETDALGDNEPVPQEFLSDEEIVFGLLDDHDGRIRQADIVEETEWSKSKVSRVLSAMEDDDAIVKIDVGRGNIVMRPEDVPPGAGSALED